MIDKDLSVFNFLKYFLIVVAIFFMFLFYFVPIFEVVVNGEVGYGVGVLDYKIIHILFGAYDYSYFVLLVSVFGFISLLVGFFLMKALYLYLSERAQRFISLSFSFILVIQPPFIISTLLYYLYGFSVLGGSGLYFYAYMSLVLGSLLFLIKYFASYTSEKLT